MSPHNFVIGAVTNEAKKAIESVGGSVEVTGSMSWHNPKGKAFRITLPSNACITANNWDKPRDAVNTRWYHIELPGLTLKNSGSQEDREGTLDLVKAGS